MLYISNDNTIFIKTNLDLKLNLKEFNKLNEKDSSIKIYKNLLKKDTFKSEQPIKFVSDLKFLKFLKTILKKSKTEYINISLIDKYILKIDAGDIIILKSGIDYN